MVQQNLVEAVDRLAVDESVLLECWGKTTSRFTPAPDIRDSVAGISIDSLLSSGLLRLPFLTARRDGKEIPSEQYTETRNAGSSSLPGYIVLSKVRELVDGGASVLFSFAHQWIEPIGVLCNNLRIPLEVGAGATIFYTPPGQQALKPHRDGSHVFVVQLAGSKRWLVQAQADAEPATGGVGEEEFDRIRADMSEFVLRAGEGLYLPTGVAHVASSADEPSLHLSLYLTEPRTRDLLYVAIREILKTLPDCEGGTGAGAERVEWISERIAYLAGKFADVDRGAVGKLLADHVASLRQICS